MAYLAFADGGTDISGERLPSRALVLDEPVPRQAEVAAARLSGLEWAVVALAAKDGLASLRQPGAVAIAMGRLFGERRNPVLADPRLEALRRIAVLSWHYGYTVPGAEVRRFLDAGFGEDQYELVVDSIAVAHRKRRGRPGRDR